MKMRGSCQRMSVRYYKMASFLISCFLLCIFLTYIRWLGKPWKIEQLRSRELSEKHRAILVDLLRTFIEVADELKLTWFINYGALIGSWRHHGIVPWDDDIDIMVPYSQSAALVKRFNTRTPAGYNPMWHVWGGTIVKLSSNKSDVLVQTSPDHYWPYIDIMLFEENEDIIWAKPPFLKGIKIPKADVFPLRKRPFEGLWVNSPRFPPKVLMRVTQWSDPFNCETGSSHQYQQGKGPSLPKIRLPCEDLKDLYPFVHRKYVNGMMVETLKLGIKIIHRNYVNESKDSMTPPFSFKPKNHHIHLTSPFEYLVHSVRSFVSFV